MERTIDMYNADGTLTDEGLRIVARRPGDRSRCVPNHLEEGRQPATDPDQVFIHSGYNYVVRGEQLLSRPQPVHMYRPEYVATLEVRD